MYEQTTTSGSELAGAGAAGALVGCGVGEELWRLIADVGAVFPEKMGKHPKAWLSEQRQQRANELIQGGSSVKETAAQLGYKHPSHLTNEFKKQWGCCPTDKPAPMRAQNP